MSILQFLAQPLVFNPLVLLASIFILYKSADLIVTGITSYAKRLGLSEALIGLVVVAMAASAPEIISSIIGFAQGSEGVGFGAILGSNMVHAAFALGLLCLIGKKITLEPNLFTKRRLAMWGALMLPFILASDGLLSRADGAILVGAFVAYLATLWRMEGTLGKLKKQVQLRTLWRDVFVFLGGFAALMLAGRYLVFSSVQIAKELAIPPYFIALTVIGIGTTVPDLVIELRALFGKHASIGLGDLLGSLIIELLLFFGIVALVQPIAINLSQVLPALIALGFAITLIMYWMNKRALTWRHGLVFMGIYAVFLAIEISRI